MRFIGKIENGRPVINQFERYLAGLKEGTRFSVSVEKWKNKRSMKQNAYYWAALTTISEHTGHTPQELHEIFKRMFLPPQFIQYKGEKIKVPGSTTKLSSAEFAEYIERIGAEAASMGITIQTPDEYYA